MDPWLAADPSGPNDDPPPFDPGKERHREVETKERAKSARPPRFKVILYNDDYTPMEFVVQILQKTSKLNIMYLDDVHTKRVKQKSMKSSTGTHLGGTSPRRRQRRTCAA